MCEHIMGILSSKIMLPNLAPFCGCIWCTMCEHALSANINAHISTHLNLIVALFMVFSITYTICKGPKVDA